MSNPATAASRRYRGSAPAAMADTPISRYDVLGTVFFEGADEAPPVMSLATTGIGFRPHPAGAALAGRLRDRPGRPATPIATPVPVRRSVTPS